ncbi:MAG: DUF2845 domain-containing protein [Pseudomonadota bacterium]
MGNSRRPGLLIAAAMLALLLPDLAWAFRCGSKLVVDGDPADKVIAICGSPTEKTSYTALRPPLVWVGNRPVRVLPGGPIEVLVETWIYNLGPHKLMQRVRLEGGYVVEVTALGYGHL